MRLNELFDVSAPETIDYHIDVPRVLADFCSDYLQESGGIPLYKNLPSSYDDFSRVKIRQKKHSDSVSSLFSEALALRNVRQRCLLGKNTISEAAASEEPFYIFPINGFSYTYSPKVTDFLKEYAETIDRIGKHIGSAEEIALDLIRKTYVRCDLVEGIKCGAEIVFYDFPFYFAAKVSSFPQYHILTKV